MIDNPALTISLALAAGMLGQSLAHHARIPGIVILLALGVLLGPDVANLIRPASLGDSLFLIVGFAVAVILFEGGMNLQLSRLKRERRTIRSMITIGALITAVLAVFTTRHLLHWDWRQAILFGTLIPVTGPTVVSPLLRRIRVKSPLKTILEAEGIMLDAIAAIVAAVALEVAIAPLDVSLVQGGMDILLRLGFGVLLGTLGGFALVALFRVRNLVPQGLENVFTLSLVLALFQISNGLMPESGIVAVTMAGLVIGNSKTLVLRELFEFKEQLTVMLIGMLFILLAADVRLTSILNLGWGGVFTVLLLIFIIRPFSVFVATVRSQLDVKQKIFLAWIGPRGIVAAAVASLFSYELEHQGYPGEALRAMVFLVISVSVLQAGLSGGLLAGKLGLRRKSKNGWVILGAHELARVMGGILKSNGQDVVCIDSNPKCVQKSEAAGLRVIFGNGLDEAIILRSEIDTRQGIIAMTPNQDLNMLFAQQVKQIDRSQSLILSVQDETQTTAFRMVEDIGASVLSGNPFDMEAWLVMIRHNQVLVQEWVFEGQDERDEHLDVFSDDLLAEVLLPLTTTRNGSLIPMDHRKRLKAADIITLLINLKKQDEATLWLSENKFTFLHPVVPEDVMLSSK
ncbi:MAG: cation:proton antiporter [Candidatus Marinimicrobia bacterium]|nr:cation:proton antiporter [Candidatus Neomarinimicrobiota bacterium]